MKAPAISHSLQHLKEGLMFILKNEVSFGVCLADISQF